MRRVWTHTRQQSMENYECFMLTAMIFVVEPAQTLTSCAISAQQPRVQWHPWPVLRFGIPGYQPHWLNGRDSIRAAHGRRLAGLVGLTLRHLWLAWDLDDDEWFADAPVLLDFEHGRPGPRYRRHCVV